MKRTIVGCFFAPIVLICTALTGIADIQYEPNMTQYFLKDNYVINGVDVGAATSLGNRIPLLLIHGINLTQASDGTYPEKTGDWQNFLVYFNSQNELKSKYKVYLYGYRSNELPVDYLAMALRTILDLWSAKHPDFAGRDIVVLAHSMGGLVARSLMAEHVGGTTTRWGDRMALLITLGTPHHGTPGANSTHFLGALDCAILATGNPTYALIANGVNKWFFHVDFNQYNRRDLLWDNYDPNMLNNSCFANRPNEVNSLLLSLNSDESVTRAYDYKIVAYAGNIGPNGNLVEDKIHEGQIVIAGATGMPSDGIVPVQSALFDGASIAASRVWPEYDHFEMCTGVTANPLSEPLFDSIRQDLINVASTVTRPSAFTIATSSRYVGGAPQNVITWTPSVRAVTYNIYCDGTLIGSRTSQSSEFVDSGVVAGQTYTYRVDAVSASGATTSEARDCQTLTTRPDTTPPAAPVSLVAVPGGWSRNNQFWIAWYNPADQSGISKVWYKWGSPPTSPSDGTSLPVPQNDPFLASINKSDGTDTLFVWLEDGVGNKNQLNRAALVLGVDATPPTVAITSPQSSGTFATSAGTGSVSGTYADALSGVTNVTWFSSIAGSGNATMSGGFYSGTWTTPAIALFDGINTITITAQDYAGNVSCVSLALNHLSSANSGSVSVNISPLGAVSAGAQWRVNGGAWRGQAEANVPTGSRYVEFLPVSGWVTPSAFWVTVNAGQTAFASAIYSPVIVAQPAYQPSNPSPPHGAVNVGRMNPTFSWSGGSPNGPVDFGFVLGTNSNPTWSDSIWAVGYGGITGSSVQCFGLLNSSQTYYWRVLTRDYTGTITTGTVWNFTTEYSMADLVTTSIAVNGNIAPGTNVDVIVTVQNQGNLAYPSAYIRIYLSQTPGAKETMLTYPSCAFTGGLQPGQSQTFTQTVALVGLQAGQSFLDVWLDTTAYGPSAESNYDNNTKSLAISYIDGKAPEVASVGINCYAGFVKTGESRTLVAFAQDNVGVTTMDFYVSPDGGLTWNVVQEGFVPVGATVSGVCVPWTVPGDFPLTTNLLVRAVARDASGNWGELIAGPYVVWDGTQPSITVLSPNGGELWDMGSTHDVTWSVSAPNGFGLMQLWFYHDNTADFIANVRTNTTGRYSWTLRSNFSTSTGRIRIQVTDLNGNEAEDFSDNYFAIRDTSAPPPAPWTVPQQVTSLSAGDPGNNGKPRITTDASGNLHMVYLYGCDTGYSPRVITQTVLYRTKTASGWTAPSVVYSLTEMTDASLNGYYSLGQLSIAVDSGAKPHVAWATSYDQIPDLNKNDIYYSCFDGTGWSSPQNLSDTIRGPFYANSLTWVVKQAMHAAGSGSASAVANGKLYVLGGSFFLQTYEYSPQSDSWARKSDIPSGGISDGGAAEISGRIYAVGNSFDGKVKIYNPTSNLWTEGAAIANQRAGMVVVAVGGKLYAMGDTGSNQTRNEMYDPVSNTWVPKADMPTGRGYATATVVDGLIYVIGGISGGSTVGTVEVYDPANNTWSTRSKPVAANWPCMMGATACVVNNRIYVIGGRDSSGHCTFTVNEYDPQSNSWAGMNPMPAARAFAAVGVIDSKIYVAVGADDTGELASVEEATVTSNLTGRVSGDPHVVVDSSDRVHVAWVDGVYWQPDGNSFFGCVYRGTNNIYSRSKASAQGWSAVTQLTTDGATMPSISADRSNHVYLVHEACSNESQNSIGFLNWGGASWSPPAIVFGNGANFNNKVDSAVDGQGGFHVVWRNYDGTPGDPDQTMYSRYDGNSWSLPETVQCNESGTPAQIGSDSLCRPHVVWELRNYPGKLLYRTKGGNQWYPSVQLNMDGQIVDDDSSDVALSPVNDEMHAVWTSEANGHSEVFYNHAYVGGTNDVYAPSVSVLAPGAGEVLSIGGDFEIRWNAVDNTGVVGIDLYSSFDGGSNWTLIATNEINEGSFMWSVPSTATASGQIRVTARDGAGNAGTGYSASFTTTDITPPSIAFLSPTGGVALVGNSTAIVNWVAADNVEVTGVDLDYSLGNESQWFEMGTNLPNTGTFAWVVPNSASERVVIRGTARDAVGLSACATNALVQIVRANTPPSQPHSPFPVNGQVNVPVRSPTLQWSAWDADGDALTYQIRLGTATNPPIIFSGRDYSCLLGLMKPATTYYWQALVSDGTSTNTGALWTFTTEPGTLPRPVLSGVECGPNGVLLLSLDGVLEDGYILQASTNLLDWSDLMRITISNRTVLLTDPAATNYMWRFYRTRTE